MSNETRNTIIVAFSLLAILWGIGVYSFYGRAEGQVLQNEVVNIKQHISDDLGRIERKLDTLLSE